MLIEDIVGVAPTLQPYEDKISAALNSKTALWRGLSNMSDLPKGSVKLQLIRPDRILRDSTYLEAYIFDYFMETLGFPFRKRNSVSATVSRNQAMGFGHIMCRVYPVNGTKFLYSTKFGDFTYGITRNAIKPIMKLLVEKYNIALTYSALSSSEMNRIYREYPQIRKEMMAFFDKNHKDINSKFLGFSMTDDINQVALAEGEVLLYGVLEYLAYKEGPHSSIF